MCYYSPRCKRSWCHSERHHWLEIKGLAGPITKSEATELAFLRMKEHE